MFRLETVDLSHNHIAEFPTMKNLPNMTTLNLSNNRICELPNGYNFPKLTNLNLAHNGISKVPPQIFSETILTNLLLTGNTVSQNALQDMESIQLYLDRRQGRVDKALWSDIDIKNTLCGI